MFPNIVSEDKIDFKKLKQELSDEILDNTKEKYELTWPGKKEAIITANKPITKTLRPDRDKSVDFDNTKNIYIEGDNLEALKILQESYLNKIKCIYIDPPYNTGHDFIYKDNFSKNENEELVQSGQIDEEGNKLVANLQSNGRFHSDWLSMMYPRLKLARNLLTEDGVIFISIDEHEVSNLITMVNEIYGECNCDILVWRKTGKQGNTKEIRRFKTTHEYIIVAYKNKSVTLLGKTKLIPKWGNTSNPDKDPRGNWMSGNISNEEKKSRLDSPNYYTITTPSGREVTREWFISKDEYEKLSNDIMINPDGKKVSRIYCASNGDGVPRIKRFVNEPQEFYFDTIIDEMGTFTDARNDLKDLFGGNDLFPTPKSVKVIQELIRISTKSHDSILDFFSGSATTAQAVLELNAEKNENRKFIMVQIAEPTDDDVYKQGYKTICEIGQERIRRAGKKIKEETNADIDYGFRVYKVDSSNMEDVFYTSDKLTQEQLPSIVKNIKKGRKSEDLLTQVILDLGLTLDLKIEEKQIKNNKVYIVDNNKLAACFDDKIDTEIVDEICTYNPQHIVFTDRSFNNDEDKINTVEKIKNLSHNTKLIIL